MNPSSLRKDFNGAMTEGHHKMGLDYFSRYD